MNNPSVLWLSLESVRADHTSLYGYNRQTTPYLESLSERSDATKIDPMISASMWTPASTASLLTGTHMSTHQVGQDGKGEYPLPSSIKTLPNLLSDAGYQTALFSTNPFISSSTGLDQGFDYIENASLTKNNFSSVDTLAWDSIKTALTSLITQPTLSPGNAKKYLSRRSNTLLEYRVSRWFNGAVDPEKPFFAYAHIPSPHHPYRPVDRFLDEFSSNLEISASEARNRVCEIFDGTDAIKKQMHNGLEFSDETWGAIKTLYDAEIRHADYTAKQIVKKAEKESERPLIIIIVGDHGELFDEYGLIGHNLVLHDGVTRVPGLVVGIDDVCDPKNVVTQHIDLTYTVASLTDVVNDQLQGRDLRDPHRPYAISQRGVAHLDTYTKYGEGFDPSRFFKSPFTSIRTPEYKLLLNESRTVLYDLPDEETDISDKNPDIVTELSSHLDREEIIWSDPKREQIEYDTSTKNRLRDLGYIT